MNGAQSLVATLVNAGVEVCFTNPGTSEMHFVAALDEVEGMRGILCLFEGVASGAADAYARMADKPASTLLHLAPGLGNALANVHNCKKGGGPLINIVGNHATHHLQYDAPLTADVEAVAAPVSHWVKTSPSAAEIAEDGAQAVSAAGRNRVATLILPADVSWGENKNGVAKVNPLPAPARVADSVIDQTAALLTSGSKCMLMVGGYTIDDQRGLMLNRIGKAAGARVMTDTFMRRVSRGAGTGVLERLPYMAEMAIAELKDVEQLVLIGTGEPIAFFAYPNTPSTIAPTDSQKFTLLKSDEDIDDALERLLERLDAVDESPTVHPLVLPDLPGGELNPETIGAVLLRQITENTIVVDEAVTTGLAIYGMTATAQPHDWLTVTGGSIGWGLPAAVGAAVACPERKVLCLEGDGSAMYTNQALWTMAREHLDVTVVIFSNRKYRILELEFFRTDARDGVPGPKAASMLDIGDPTLDFVALAHSMGVQAQRVDSVKAFDNALAEAMLGQGPQLIDVIMPVG